MMRWLCNIPNNLQENKFKRFLPQGKLQRVKTSFLKNVNIAIRPLKNILVNNFIFFIKKNT
jgi:hypothetical protein